VENPAGLAVRLSERHFGVGGEGVALLYESGIADFRMVMYNLDGTEGGMSGNAVRCLAKYAHDVGMTPKDKLHLTVETRSGVKDVWLIKRNGIVSAAAVDMGRAAFEPELVPVNIPGSAVRVKRLAAKSAFTMSSSIKAPARSTASAQRITWSSSLNNIVIPPW